MLVPGLHNTGGRLESFSFENLFMKKIVSDIKGPRHQGKRLEPIVQNIDYINVEESGANEKHLLICRKKERITVK